MVINSEAIKVIYGFSKGASYHGLEDGLGVNGQEVHSVNDFVLLIVLAIEVTVVERQGGILVDLIWVDVG